MLLTSRIAAANRPEHDAREPRLERSGADLHVRRADRGDEAEEQESDELAEAA